MAALFDTRQARELISGAYATNRTSFPAASVAGMGEDFSGTANQQYAHRAAFAIAGPLTIVVLCDVDALTGFGAVIAKQNTTTSVTPYELRAGLSGTDTQLMLGRASAAQFMQSRAGTVNRVSAGARGLLLAVSDVGGVLTTANQTFYVNTVAYPAITAGGVADGSAVTDDGSSAVWIGRRFDGATQLDGRIYFVALFNRALGSGALKLLVDNPWQLFAPIPAQYWALGATVQLLRPTSDISAGAWTPSSGLTLAPMLNEAVADDASFIQTTSSSTSEVAFGTGLSPGVTTGHTIRFRAKGIGALSVSLVQGATVISTFTPSMTTSYALYSWTLSGAEAATISNYSDLRLRFIST